MPTKLLEGFGGKLVDQWAANLLTPAFVFWLGGLLAWGDRHPWPDLTTLNTLDEPLQIAVLIVALLVVIATGFVIQRFDLAVLRFFEGYWPPFLKHLRRWCLTRQQTQFDRLDGQLLYEALHLPKPANPAEERQMGQTLTEYLWRGGDRPTPAFLYPKK